MTTRMQRETVARDRRVTRSCNGPLPGVNPSARLSGNSRAAREKGGAGPAELVREPVARAGRDHVGDEGTAEQRQVADQVQQLVTGRLVLHPPLIVDGLAVVADHEHVAGSEVREEPELAGRLGL